MALLNGPNLGLLVHGAVGEAHYTELMRLLRGIDALVMPKAKDKDLATPPASPVDGDTYIVAASPTGAWVGHTGKLARWSTALDPDAWEFITPKEGWEVWLDDEDKRYRHNGTVWAEVASGAGVANLSIANRGAATLDVASDTGTDATIPAATGALSGLQSAADKTKLDGIAAGATANSTDAALVSRANHTGTQTAATVSDFNAAADARIALGIPVNTQNANYTLVLTDAGKAVVKDNGTAYAWTIPPNSTVAFPIGTMITARVKNAAGAITLTRGTGVVLRKAGSATDGNLTLAVWGMVTLLKEGTNDWVASGTGI